MKIGDIEIGQEHPPFIIAEMSGNHNRSLDRALQILEAVAATGAQAIKLQTYTADTITLDVKTQDFEIRDPESLWAGRKLHDLYREAFTPWEWHEPLFRRAKELGLVCFSTPFDESAVSFLSGLHVPAFKIASFENNHLPLIACAAQTGKPLLISTGMASVAELDEAVKTARDNGCRDLILLKCTSSYPASPEQCNLRTIPHLKDLFHTEVGLSDHTKGIGAALVATGLGATVIEKHVTLNRSEGGVDSAFSLEPHELKIMVEEVRNSWLALGKVYYGATDQEKKSLMFKRSLYIAEDIKAGERLTEKNLRCIRPGYGLQPRFLNSVLGKKVRANLKKGTPLKLEHLLDS